MIIISMIAFGFLCYKMSETRKISTGVAIAWGAILGPIGALVVYFYEVE